MPWEAALEKRQKNKKKKLKNKNKKIKSRGDRGRFWKEVEGSALECRQGEFRGGPAVSHVGK